MLLVLFGVVQGGAEAIVAPYMPTEVEHNIVEEAMYAVHEVRLRTLLFPPYYQRTVELDIYHHLNSLLDAALNLSDHHSNVFISEEEVLYLRITV